jgi:hypothetical protein
MAPELISPNAGASDSKIKPIFQWSAVVGAQKYELLVATDALFTAPVIAKVGDSALPATAWQCDIKLDHDTTYYWKVRAIGSGTYSAWSAVSAFGTDPLQVQANPSPAPEPLPTVPQSSPSPPPSQSNTPEWPIWLMYLGAALLFTTIATLITLIILTVRVWRL